MNAMKARSTLFPLLAFACLVAGCAAQDAQRAGDLVIAAPWSRETPPGATVAAGYLSIENTGSVDDRLLSVESRAAERVEIHESSMADGMMRMRQRADGMPIPAGKTVAFAPGGNHLMFIGPRRRLAAGDTLDAVLVFRRAGRLPVTFRARSMTAQGPSAQAHH